LGFHAQVIPCSPFTCHLIKHCVFVRSMSDLPPNLPAGVELKRVERMATSISILEFASPEPALFAPYGPRHERVAK
jgi:hypothetical protein